MANKISLDKVDFSRELTRIEKEIDQLTNLDIIERMDYATDQLKVVTPVDTGKARSGWYNKKNIKRNKLIDGTINNDVDYIVSLNRGHSQQAPKYFIEQVLSKIGIITPD